MTTYPQGMLPAIDSTVLHLAARILDSLPAIDADKIDANQAIYVARRALAYTGEEGDALGYALDLVHESMEARRANDAYQADCDRSL